MPTAKQKRRPGQRGDMPHTIAKRYKVRESVIEAIDRAAPVHGSLGRALQVAMELLVRLPKPVKISETLTGKAGKSGTSPGPKIGKTYKLTPRTIELIEQMTPIYGSRGDVLAACAEILKG